jgi:hypothetical protein
MSEFLPLLFGLAVGLTAISAPRRGGVRTAAAYAVPLGFAASLINGELAKPWLVAFDVSQVFVAIVVTAALARRAGLRRDHVDER